MYAYYMNEYMTNCLTPAIGFHLLNEMAHSHLVLCAFVRLLVCLLVSYHLLLHHVQPSLLTHASTM